MMLSEKSGSSQEAASGAVPQEHALGCAVACVAYRLGLSYRGALALFDQRESAWLRGYYCPEVVAALSRGGARYHFTEYQDALHSEALALPGAIVFVEPCDEYPAGHYMIRAGDGWMNSWINFPQMIPVEAGIQAKLPGKVSYVIYPADQAME